MTKALKNRIEAALYQKNGFRYQHPDWDKKLWLKKKDEIKEYLLKRFLTTMDVVEYYSCMVLLYHTIPNKELLIDFKDSKQQSEFSTTNKTPKTSTETPISFEINQVKTVNQVTVIGE
jgi:hypothetical protein